MELEKAQSYFFQASTSLTKNQGNANFSDKSTIFLKTEEIFESQKRLTIYHFFNVLLHCIYQLNESFLADIQIFNFTDRD